MISSSLALTWDQLSSSQPLEQANWSQRHATASLQLFAQTDLPFDAPILDVSSDLTSFLNDLLSQGYTNLIASHADATVLDQHRQLLAPEQAQRVLWVVDDPAKPQHLPLLDPVLLWHDRNTLHGLVSRRHVVTYCRLLHYMVAAQGWVVVGVEALEPDPVLSSAGLPTPPLSLANLQTLLGTDFKLHSTFPEPAHFPQDADSFTFTYALFQRTVATSRGAWLES